MKRVCMLLMDDELVDYRVVYEAEALVENGYHVRVVMPGTSPQSYKHPRGFEVVRVPSVAPKHDLLLSLALSRNDVWMRKHILRRYDRERIARELVLSDLGGMPDPVAPQTTAPPKKTFFTRLNNARRHATYSSLKLFGLWSRFNINHLLLNEVSLGPAAIEFNPDFVHAHDLTTLHLGHQVAKSCNAKLIYDAHELYPYQGLMPRNWVAGWKRHERKYIATADAVITVNAFLARFLEKRYHLEHVHVVHNTAHWTDIASHEEERSKARSELLGGRHFEGVLLLHVAALLPGRGLPQLIEAIRQLPSQYELVFMGDGPEKASLQIMASALGIEHRIHFYGMAPREEVPRLCAGGDIGLVVQLPTGFNAYYCSPNRLSDYTIAGLALGVSDLPFLRKFVSRYNCGTTFDPSNPADIARAIQHLGDDSKRLHSIRANSFAAGREFNWEQEKENLLAVYHGINST